MLFLCTTRFNLREDKARQLKQFFTIYEIEAAREEKNKYLKNLKINIISNTEEHKKTSTDLVNIGETKPQLPENSTQVRVSGRKRVQREDDMFEHY
jgi:uncharacterized membrane protein YgaE (UPF0421/DUF939 family)